MSRRDYTTSTVEGAAAHASTAPGAYYDDRYDGYTPEPEMTQADRERAAQRAAEEAAERDRLRAAGHYVPAPWVLMNTEYARVPARGHNVVAVPVRHKHADGIAEAVYRLDALDGTHYEPEVVAALYAANPPPRGSATVREARAADGAVWVRVVTTVNPGMAWFYVE